MKTCIKNLDDAALADWLKENGQPQFRLKQVKRWLYEKWVWDFREMRNLPQTLRAALAADFSAVSVQEKEVVRASDETEKALLALGDGHTIETVLIRAPERQTVCISSQVGCPVRCVFCASGRRGLVRDLEPAEIVDQVVFACRAFGKRVDNVVVMGIGEPLLNFTSLAAALERINAPDGLHIGARSITVSTSGVVPGIRQLADMGKQWNLALSLHAVDDEGRNRLIPPAYRHPLKEILAACRYYREKTGRKVTFEYALIDGVNDSSSAIAKLAKLARDNDAKVNLIPYNRTAGKYEPPSTAKVQAVLDSLLGSGVQATVRREKGAEIEAACGQLRYDRSRGEQ